MKFLKYFTVLLFISCSNATEFSAEKNGAFPFEIINEKILFIGNSFTYMNSLPELISQIAISKGNSLIYVRHTPGG